MVPIFKYLIKFCTAKNLFKYFRNRYSTNQIKNLNGILKLRNRLSSLRHTIRFLRQCLRNHVVPKYISKRIFAAKTRPSPNIERAFLQDEIQIFTIRLKHVQNLHRAAWTVCIHFLSFFDMLRFSRYISNYEISLDARNSSKKENYLSSIIIEKFGSEPSNVEKHIFNLSDYTLSDTEKLVLSRGLEFCVPPSKINREDILSQFETLFAQTKRHIPISNEEHDLAKARMVELAHSYSHSPIESGSFILKAPHFQTAKSLKNNSDIYITKPDKGAGVVILNKSEYIDKMNVILSDKTKFKNLGTVIASDNTIKSEAKLQRRLLQFFKSKFLSKETYERIRPAGSQRPRMYGVPKIHKAGVPLRPILSMVGSAQHELAKWLAEVLIPVSNMYSTYCISDSFVFSEIVRGFERQSNNAFMCSFDVTSLFTNVPIEETINICADVLYRGNSTPLNFPRKCL